MSGVLPQRRSRLRTPSRDAFDGIEAAYFAYPFDDVMLDAGCNFALAICGATRVISK